MRTFVVVIALSSSLAGCLTLAQQQQQERNQQFLAAAKECIATNKTAFAKIQCENAAESRIWGRETALMAWKHAENLKIALRLDKGEISKEQASIEFKEVQAKIKLQAEQIAEAEAERRAAVSAALIEAGAGLLANSQPAAPVPPPTPTVTQMQCYPNPFGQAGMRCNAQ
jgi:hypothetical protein